MLTGVLKAFVNRPFKEVLIPLSLEIYKVVKNNHFFLFS